MAPNEKAELCEGGCMGTGFAVGGHDDVVSDQRLRFILMYVAMDW